MRVLNRHVNTNGPYERIVKYEILGVGHFQVHILFAGDVVFNFSRLLNRDAMRFVVRNETGGLTIKNINFAGPMLTAEIRSKTTMEIMNESTLHDERKNSDLQVSRENNQ